MKVRILSSSTDGASKAHFALSMLVNDSVCIDAGCLGLGEISDQLMVNHLFLSHAHIDHTATLPIFLENVFGGTKECVTVHASRSVHEALEEDMFNDRTWPDFIELSTPEAPFLRRSTLEPGRGVEADGLLITPVEVNHGTDTCGFIVDDGRSAFLFSADTAPTEKIWAVANQTANLKAAFLECSFPDSMARLADVSFHMTPALFGREVKKLKRDVVIHPISIKARFHDETCAELVELGLKNLRFPPIGEAFEI